MLAHTGHGPSSSRRCQQRGMPITTLERLVLARCAAYLEFCRSPPLQACRSTTPLPGHHVVKLITSLVVTT